MFNLKLKKMKTLKIITLIGVVLISMSSCAGIIETIDWNCKEDAKGNNSWNFTFDTSCEKK